MLGRGEQAPPPPPEREHVSPTVRRLIDNLGTSPAYLLGRRWDFLAWNEAASAVFGSLERLAAEKRNHVWLTFMDPARRELTPDWEQNARRMLARFRVDHAQHVGDPSFEKLVAKLLAHSPEFRRWWPRHEVASSGEGRKELLHPVVGRLAFEHAVFRRAEALEQRLILYSPLPDHDTPAKLARLLDDLRRGQRERPDQLQDHDASREPALAV
jgi:hypothetical protein